MDVMTSQPGSELYGENYIIILEHVWGDGWLSPGGPEEVKRLLEGMNLKGKSVLDIDCGAGGIEIELVKTHGAGYVTGIDVEDTVLGHARKFTAKAGIADRVGVMKVVPGPLPFPSATFDVVFSKDSIVHIPDKHTLMHDVFRVLKPGGWFVASDWLIGHDNEPSPQMKSYIASEGLDFGMASPERYKDAMISAGFINVELRSRNAWYRERAREELQAMKGPLYASAVAKLGKEFVDRHIQIWIDMVPVLQSGEHCPTHLRAQKPV